MHHALPMTICDDQSASTGVFVSPVDDGRGITSSYITAMCYARAYVDQ